MNQLEMLEEVDRAAWNARIVELGGPVQMSTEWCDFTCAKGGVRPLFVRGGSQDEVRTIVYIERSAKWPLSRWPTALSDCLPLANEPMAVLLEIESQLRQRGCAAYQLNSMAQTGTEPLPLAHLGYEESHRVEFVIALDRGLDEAFKAMRSGLRSQIRRSERAGVRFTASQDPAIVDELCRIEQETSQRHNTQGKASTAMRRETFELMWPQLVRSGRVRIHLAESEAQVLAFVIVGAIGTQAYYLYGGASRAALTTDAAKGLMWHAIQQAYGDGARQFNLGGMGAEAADPASPDHGLHQYKRGLGGVERACTSGFKVLRPRAMQARQGLHQAVDGLRGLRHSLQALAARRP